MPKLRFYAEGTAMVPDIDAQNQGIRRFLGRKVATHESGAAMFVPTDEPCEVEYHAEYVLDCKAGCLRPADAETAKLCGVDFKPEPAAKAGKKEA